MEAVVAELLAALGAEEVLGVPGLIQGCHAFIQDWTVAVSTSWTEEIMVISFAVRTAVTFEEVTRA